MKKLLKYLPVFIVGFMLFPLIADAAVFSSRCRELQGIADSAYKLCNLIVDIRILLYWGSLTFAVIMIIIGGIMYMTAGSQEEKATKAKKTLTAGLIGAAIIFASGFILDLLEEVVVNRLL